MNKCFTVELCRMDLLTETIWPTALQGLEPAALVHHVFHPIPNVCCGTGRGAQKGDTWAWPLVRATRVPTSIHLSSIPPRLESIPAVFGQDAGYTLDMSPANHRADKQALKLTSIGNLAINSMTFALSNHNSNQELSHYGATTLTTKSLHSPRLSSNILQSHISSGCCVRVLLFHAESSEWEVSGVTVTTVSAHIHFRDKCEPDQRQYPLYSRERFTECSFQSAWARPPAVSSTIYGSRFHLHFYSTP